jgi:hypothetical protein
MADDFIRVEASSKENFFDLIGQMPDKAQRLLRATIEDIADEIETLAKEKVPVDTGVLRQHPVDRKDLKRRVQGPGGLVVKTELSVPSKPKYAKWVHEGTGIYGPKGVPITPRKAPFMVFNIDGKWFRKKSVQGQEPQPYLREAIEEAENTIIPIRLAELRVRLLELE